MTKSMILIDKTTRQPINVGDTVTTFRGENVILKDAYPHDGMEGKVTISDWPGTLYPSVINAEFVEAPAAPEGGDAEATKARAEELAAARKIKEIRVDNLTSTGEQCAIHWKAVDGSARFHIWVDPKTLKPSRGCYGGSALFKNCPLGTERHTRGYFDTRTLDQTSKANAATIRYVTRIVRELGLIERMFAEQEAEKQAERESRAEAARVRKIKEAGPELLDVLKLLIQDTEAPRSAKGSRAWMDALNIIKGLDAATD